jgi:ABC-type glycerol-3-phosphate transport system permease component
VLITSTMFISAGSLYLFPQLQIAKALNINTSLWGVIIINVFGINVTQLYISRNYINSISKEIDEAARIDGCGFFRIYRSIILPLTKPLIATVGLLAFMNSWNDYMLPMVFTLGNPDKRPLVVGILTMRTGGESVTSWHLMFAGTSMAVLPMLVVYLCLNKYFISGLTSGAIKG